MFCKFKSQSLVKNIIDNATFSISMSDILKAKIILFPSTGFEENINKKQ